MYRQDPLVERNRDVVVRRLEVGLNRVLQSSARRLRRECRRHRQQLVNGGWRVFLLGEAVALGQGFHLVRADAIDEPIELFADARFRAPAVRGLEQNRDGLVELLLRRPDVAKLELMLSPLEMPLGGSNQREHWIFDRGLGGGSGGSCGGCGSGARGICRPGGVRCARGERWRAIAEARTAGGPEWESEQRKQRTPLNR